LEDTPEQVALRDDAVAHVYPKMGNSAQTAADAINEFVLKEKPPLREFATVGQKTVGIVYMSFGEKAAIEAANSIRSLRNVNLKIPITSIGNTPVNGTQFIRWMGESPYNLERARNFKFLAGCVKPHIFELSPYDYTLYIDADTEYISDITPGFDQLGKYDFCIAEELKRLKELHAPADENGKWELPITEWKETMKIVGEDVKFLNSGVIFFRKSAANKRLFLEWSKEWSKYNNWDEQMALMRAINLHSDVKVLHLSPDWNHPHREQARIIFHNYGRGIARTDGE
jgi:hypothetical protein